jgi:hypothetical protein
MSEPTDLEIEHERPAPSIVKVNVNVLHLPRSAIGPKRKDAEIAHMRITGDDTYK